VWVRHILVHRLKDHRHRLYYLAEKGFVEPERAVVAVVVVDW
jgi:hypothetical protein